MQSARRVIATSFLTASLCLLASGSAAAHVTVKPAEAVTAGFQTFTVSAPNEKDIAFTAVKLEIPNGLRHVSPTVKPGWQIDISRQGQDNSAPVNAITWRGGSVASGLREEFSFSAQVPAQAGELRWKAYQTYANGTTVAWNLTEDQQPKKADGSPDFSVSGPYSVTKIAASSASDQAIQSARDEASRANGAAARAQAAGIIGIIVGLLGIYLATRRSSPKKDAA